MRSGWLVGIAMLVGCAHNVEVAYTQAAQINLGKDVQKVLVVERVGAGNTGESIIDFAEGVLTGEGLEGDADTSSAAIRGLIDTMNTTRRFDIVDTRVGGRRVDENLFGGQMAPKQVIKMCEKAGCDAIIAVDALDTDTVTAIDVERDPVFGPEVDAQTDTRLSATFRVYEKDGSLRDESRVRNGASTSVTDAASVAEAAAGVGPSRDLQNDLAYQAGVAYAARISPHAVIDTRKLYTSGDPRLKDAWQRVKGRDWAGAVALWKEVAKDGDDKAKAKATYNLAIAKERRGKLDEARTLAKAAERELSKGRTRDYIAVLDGRIRNQKRVEKQMGEVTGG